jgi:Rha family phage regulatory protein
METTQKEKGRDPGKCATPTTRVDHTSTDLVRVTAGAAVTDSLVIAQAFGRAHKNVLSSLDGLISDGTINGLDFKPVQYRDGKGERRRAIELTERGALIAMPFIGGARAREGQVRLVDAFMMLRERQSPSMGNVPQALPDVLRLAADLAEQRARLEQTVEEQAPRVAAFDRLAASVGSMPITAAAKVLKVQPKFLFNWLSREQWVYRGADGKWVAYQVSIMRGVLEHKTITIRRDDGTERVVFGVHVTPRGLTELARKLTDSREGSR